MKSKLVLLLIAAVGSTALVASAQTPGTYVIRSDRPGEGQDVLVPTPVPPAPPRAPAPPGQPGQYGAAHNAFYSPRSQPFFAYSFSADENNLSHQAEQFAQQLAAAKSDSDRDKIKGQLTELLEKQFDQRQKRHEDEIKQLEAQIKKLKDLVDKRQENRREIISARLNQIVKESQGLGW
jgi:hypothetical protein